MDFRQKIYNFINESEELKKYNTQKKNVSIFSSFIFLLSFILILTTTNIPNFWLYGLVILIINLIYIFISIYIYQKKFKNKIFDKINKNIKLLIYETSFDKILNETQISKIKIKNKIKKYNPKKTIVSSIADDASLKIQIKIKKLQNI